MIEISIEKDNLFDSVSDLVTQLYESRKSYRKLQKQFNALKTLHSNCMKRNIILYRWKMFLFQIFVASFMWTIA